VFFQSMLFELLELTFLPYIPEFQVSHQSMREVWCHAWTGVLVGLGSDGQAWGQPARYVSSAPFQ
jgi:hypothetical protein